MFCKKTDLIIFCQFCFNHLIKYCNDYQILIYHLSRMRVLILTDSVPVNVAWLQTLSSR